MNKKLSKNQALLLIGLGIFAILGSVFGLFMQVSGSDNDAYFSAYLMLGSGIVFLLFGFYFLKK